MSALSLRGVSKSFGNTAVLQNIDLEVPQGELVSLLGPSGCGKTTTLNVIAGFETPDLGDVVIDGRTVNAVPTHERGLGMVFQGHALFPHMTCFENVAFGLRTRKVTEAEVRRRVSEVMELVRLGELRDRYPRELSGGQQQRVGLARALVVQPRVLLLDEPLSNLDAKLRRAMQSEIKRIHEAVQTTMIYVTHDQEEALTLSDRIGVMNHGKLEQLDSPVAIYRWPRTRFVADFIGASSFIEGTVSEVYSGRAVVAVEGCGRTGVAAENLNTGQKVQMGVRSDRIAIRPAVSGASDPTGLVLAGNVASIVFAGPSFHVTLDLGDDRLMTAHVSTALPAGVTRGARVFISVAPDDWMIVG